MKYLFYDDYSEGAHPELLKAVVESNEGQDIGYGNDKWCELGAERVASAVGGKVDVHFVAGGTQANQIAMSRMLQAHEAIIAPNTAHLNVHEAGATEATGHKILNIPCDDGKLTIGDVERVLSLYEDEHTVLPKALSITQPTELGTIYSRDEFLALCKFAKSKRLRIYLDGARLAMAVSSPAANMPLKDVVKAGVDMFYIGGTKVGGLYGEALVVVNDELKPFFRHYVKRHGGLLAKGRSIGAQFARFFDKDELWLTLGKKSNDNAARLATGLEGVGVKLAYPQVTNQIFPVLPRQAVEKLKHDYGFYPWHGESDPQMIRLTCSWATPESAINEFVGDVSRIVNG